LGGQPPRSTRPGFPPAQQTGNTGSAIINQTGANHVANVVQGGNNNAVVINQH
jgi:hypothetical protein